jgi:hypothetical protein
MKYGDVSWRNSISFAALRKATVTQDSGFIPMIRGSPVFNLFIR